MRRLTALVLGALVALSGCSLPGHGGHEYRADFARAVQVFPAVKVRVLGIDVGQVTDVRNVGGTVQVTFRIDRSDITLPAGVQAAVVPMSLLGERYIQLFPAYQGGPALPDGATIPETRTAVPAEPDELLRSLQDYLGAIDPKTVTAFVQNAAQVLQGTGEDLNSLIQHGASVMQELASKRDDLAQMIVEMNKLTVALSTRQQAIGRLIRSYDTVAGTLNDNRTALEGTITGLNAAAMQLAALLIEHRKPLASDIEVLTRTGQTLGRNAEAFAQTSHWAKRLFLAASRAADYNRQWLRLNNQGQELGALILMRLEQRLMELCKEAGAIKCTNPKFWARRVPGLFCFDPGCPLGPRNQKGALVGAVRSVPALEDAMYAQAQFVGETVPGLIGRLLDVTVGNPGAFAWLTPFLTPDVLAQWFGDVAG
jgi:phospholipid/cholesterol/gamma-HCH transport system substrate-binding protein